MALLSTLLNLGSCGASGTLGTGVEGCKPFFKKTFSLWLTPAGFEYDGSQEWGTTYIDTLINAGTLIVLRGISVPENQSSENTLTDIGGGVEVLEDEGLYKFKYDWVKGLYFNSAIRTLVGFGIYDVTFVDTEGNIFGTEAPSGNLKGFTTAQISHNPMAIGDTQTAKESLTVQFPERNEIDTDFIWVKKGSSFNPKTVDGINQVTLTYSIAPADTDIIVNIKAIRKQDSLPFTGADWNNFSVFEDGVDMVPTAGDDSAVTGTYIITITALTIAGIVVSRLGSTAIPGEVISGKNYKSNVLSVEVA